jgi:tRNA(fMet)-specific endonuclease VapC
MYMLDTNTLIYFFKGLGNISQNLFSRSPKDIGIPSIVLFELQFGIQKSISPNKRIKQLDELTSIINVLPFGIKEAKASAQIRFQLEKQGKVIGPFDILIAGTACANNATLVTHNIKEFNRIKNLKVVDWF